MRVFKFILILNFILLASCRYEKKITAENISLSPEYSSGMVLQTSPATIIKGRANPGGVLAVKISDYFRLVKANDTGSWQAEFPEIILKEPFSIRFEGSDTSFIFNNVHAGKILVIAGDGNIPMLFSQENPFGISQPTRLIRIFRPIIKGNIVPQQQFEGGKWIPLAEALKQNKNSWLISAIQQIIPESEQPLGIIDLSWPGSQIESWLPVGGEIQLNELNIEPVYLDSMLLLNESILQQIKAMKDTCQAGIHRGVTKVWYDDEYWRITDLPVIFGKKDDYQKKRIVYLRKKIYVSSNYLSSDFYINLEYVHGLAQFYFNETKINPRVNVKGKTQLIIPDSLMRVWSNVLTVKLFCADSLSGFYGSEFICHNVDSSYYRSISTEWKYSFGLESEFPKLYPVEQIQGLAYNSLLSPATNINAESVVFQFRNSTLCQTQQIDHKLCEIFESLPEHWNKTLVYHALSLTDTLIYGIDSNLRDSIIMDINNTCGAEFSKIQIK
jgi:sialate O-acetylesterase